MEHTFGNEDISFDRSRDDNKVALLDSEPQPNHQHQEEAGEKGEGQLHKRDMQLA